MVLSNRGSHAKTRYRFGWCKLENATDLADATPEENLPTLKMTDTIGSKAKVTIDNSDSDWQKFHDKVFNFCRAHLIF